MRMSSLYAPASACVLALAVASLAPRPAIAATTHKITLGPTYFSPAASSVVFSVIGGQFLKGGGSFYAPVALPANATVTRLRLFAYDDAPTKLIDLLLVKTKPTTSTAETMATVGSTGASATVRTFSTTTVSGNPVGTGMAPFVQVAIPEDSADLQFAGAEILYTTP